MEQQYYVYRFKNKDSIILYVGRTTNLYQRFKQHEHLTEDVKTIEYIECTSEAEMIWKEIYYINLFYNELSTNISDVYHGGKIKDIGLNDFWKRYSIKPIPPKINDYKISLDIYNQFLGSIPKYKYKELIHILDNYKMNEIGKEQNAISEKWINTNQNLLPKLKNNVANYFCNIAKSHSSEVLWTTYDKESLKGKGYTKGFVELHNYSSQKGAYIDRTSLAYLANVYYPVKMTKKEITDNQFALFNILNFIFQSGLYYGLPINIYIPSKRMRSLLEEWINKQNYEENK